MHFITIRVRKDNLMYLFFDDTTAFAVDAFDANAVVHALGCDFARQQYTAAEIRGLGTTRPPRGLVYALTTHGHPDHAGGDSRLRALSPGTEFISYHSTHHCSVLQMGPYTIKSLFTPCHTVDSVSFLVTVGGFSGRAQGGSDQEHGIGDQEYGMLPIFTSRDYLLTGDFLFRLGCGKFFEGTGRDFLGSLAVVYESCCDETLLLYGHDYNSTNRRFAAQFFERLPTEFFLRLSDEKRHNPFMCYGRTGVAGTPEEAVSELRRRKDAFG